MQLFGPFQDPEEHRNIDCTGPVLRPRTSRIVNVCALCCSLFRNRTDTSWYRPWLMTVKYCLQISNNSNPCSFLYQVLSETNSSIWLIYIRRKIDAIGLSLDSLSTYPHLEVYQKIKQRFLDTGLWNFNCLATKTCSPLNLSILVRYGQMASYFSLWKIQRNALPFLWLGLMSWHQKFLFGRFQKIP